MDLFSKIDMSEIIAKCLKEENKNKEYLNMLEEGKEGLVIEIKKQIRKYSNNIEIIKDVISEML